MGPRPPSNSYDLGVSKNLQKFKQPLEVFGQLSYQKHFFQKNLPGSPLKGSLPNYSADLALISYFNDPN